MSNFEFVIPVSKEDLLKKTNVKDYAVEEVLPARRLPFQLKSAENEFKTKKHEIILTYFDSFYSIIEHFHMVESDVTSGGWKLILKVISSLTTSLLDLLEVDKLRADESSKQLNMVKMSCYILSLFVEKFESEAQAASTRNNTSKSFKKKGAPKSSSLADLWESEREVGVKAILQLVQLKVERLYDPPILEEEFIALVTGICYRILESCHQAKSKSTRDYIFHILGIMVKKHGHCFSCVVKLLQLLQQNEQLVVPLSQGVAVISEKYGMKSIVGEIMREIGRIDTKELSRDSACSKCVSSFLYELSRTVPEHVLPSMAEVMHLLEEESYTMRNSILGVFGELLIRLMNREDLDGTMKTTRGQFLNHLQEHLHDVNAFVRSRVLQIWQMLVEEQLELVSHFSVLLPLINARIQDKSSNVRKYAVQTIIKLIKANDVTLKLNAEGLQKNLAKELVKLKQLELEKLRKRGVLPTEAEQEGDAENDDEEAERRDTIEDAIEVGNENNDEEEVDAEYERLKTLIDYLKSSIAFITESRRSISLISLRLGSKVASDVTEAIEFLMTGYEAGMKECILGVRSMLPLIFSSEKEVKDAVVAAYKGIYLEPAHDARMPKAMCVVNSLIALANTARTLGDKEALRELIQEFVRCDLLSEEVTRILWQKFTFKIPSTTSQESKAALELIGFIASEQVEMLEANMDILISDGLQNQDYLVVMETCLVLMKLAAKKNSIDDIPNLLPKEHEIFENLTQIISQGITKVERPNFVPMVERAITAIYKLAERPDAICTDIILGQIEILSKCSKDDANCTLVETDSNTPPPNFIDDILDLDDLQQPSQRQTQQQHQQQQLCPSEYLTRFLSTCSHVAVQQLIYLDVVVFAEMKRQQRKHEKSAKRDNRKSMASVQSASASGSARMKRDEQRTIEDELGLVGHVAEDADAEFIKKVIEREVVTGGKNLLSLMEPIIVTVCSNQVKFSDPALSAVSALALVKLMAVSSEYCETHLRLLFTILEKSNNPVVRSNTIIGIGDLASRFPNQLEPWTANIYNRLRDRSMDVRLSTLQILTQLILNDMIKVKGQISEIALCILDDDPSISYTAKMFFTEFARKANAIYNILPDIVSRLSDPESAVAEEQFQPIMKFLVSFIEKEKQSESLCEKLCHRMRATVHERQWRDLSYCLSLLPANEKCIKKLNENFACFSDKLQDPYVLECMQTVVSNAKKFVKQDAKPFIEEFSDRLINHNKKKGNGDNEPGNSDEDDVIRSFIASSGKRTKSQTTNKKKNNKERRKTVAKSLRFDSDEDDEDDEEVEKTNKKKPTTSSKSTDKRPARQTKKAIIFSSSDDDLEFE